MNRMLTFALLLFSLAAMAGNSDSARVELLRVTPEPFHDYLKFEFKVHDQERHMVKIMMVNSMNQTVFMELVEIYEGHETITINTLDFHLNGLYSIKVRVDNKYKFVRSNKRY